jgi:hypothetical protein
MTLQCFPILVGKRNILVSYQPPRFFGESIQVVSPLSHPSQKINANIEEAANTLNDWSLYLELKLKTASGGRVG